MEILAPASSSFLDIHNLILENCSYVLTGNHRFFLCNEDWKTQAKVYLSDDVNLSYDEDLYLMEDAILEDFIFPYHLTLNAGLPDSKPRSPHK
jgi:hypothetical protein